ncbi:YtxH domain-containing protein [Thalassobacillus pellis]|uniref:YtxH domain-containing protein n=1 Tax=Thalassobacillus pellis TaxID=748008 RepID=UPI00195F7BCE|nr:YtxH domain-containing protein [Thalassobacillus pellis]MBM7553696.1 gas vesicle protein [Thalassobacillus pellis]
MENQKFWRGMLFGALAGGALSLLDRGTREYVWNGTKSCGQSAKNIANNPSQAIYTLRMRYSQLTNTLSEGAKDVLEVLDKVESMLETISDLEKEVEKDIEKIADKRDVS